MKKTQYYQPLTVESVLFHQIKPLTYIHPSLEKALLSINRESFLPPAHRLLAYADAPIVLKRRCEFPFYLVALFLQHLVGDRMLNTQSTNDNNEDLEPLSAAVISAGTGYTSTLLSMLCDEVCAFEPDSILFARLLDSTRKLKKITPETTLAIDKCDIIFMDGGAYTHIPQSAIDKLRVGGRVAVVKMRPQQSVTSNTLTQTLSHAQHAIKISQDEESMCHSPFLDIENGKIENVIHPDQPLIAHPLCDAMIFQKLQNGQLHGTVIATLQMPVINVLSMPS